MFFPQKKSSSPSKPSKQKKYYKDDKKTSSLCEFSNGVYQGIQNLNFFEGEGILMMDDGLFYLGEIQNDKLHGKGLLVFPIGGFYLGNFLENKMNGKGAIYYTDGKVINGTFKQSKLFGKYFSFDPTENRWLEHSDDEISLIPRISHFSEARQNIQEIFKPNRSSKTTKISIITKEDKIYIGFMKNDMPHGLGLWMGNNDRIIEYGEYKNGILNGLGKKFEKEQSCYDGVFENGEKSSIGLYFSEITSCFIYGMFNKGNLERVLERGGNFPIDIVLLFKKNVHIKSKRYLEKRVELFHLGLDMKMFGEMFYMQSNEEFESGSRDEDKNRISNEIKEDQAKNFSSKANTKGLNANLKQEIQRKSQVFKLYIK